MADYARRPRPARGWLYDFLVGILAFWFSGVIWDSFRNHDIPVVELAGAVITMVAMGLIAYQALTNAGETPSFCGVSFFFLSRNAYVRITALAQIGPLVRV